MEYVALKNEKTGEIEKLGRFSKEGLAEQLTESGWQSDSSLYSLMFDGLLEEISEAEVEKIIAQQIENEKIAA